MHYLPCRCGARVEAPDTFEGRPLRCTKCGRKIKLAVPDVPRVRHPFANFRGRSKRQRPGLTVSHIMFIALFFVMVGAFAFGVKLYVEHQSGIHRRPPSNMDNPSGMDR